MSLEVKALRALVAETKEPDGPPIHAPPPCPRQPPPEDVDETPPTVDLDMMATPLDSDDDDMEERDAEPWKTVVSSKKRNKVPVVMKLKGTSASARRGSLRQNFLDKTCIIENDVSGREVGKALLKLSPDGINEMVSALPPGVIERFMGLQPKIETLQEIQTSSSSSSLGDGNEPVEFCR